MSALRDSALAWHDAGMCVVPARPDGSKAPFGLWASFQQVRPPRDTLATWLDGTGFDGFGLICGEVSGNLEMFELEGRAVVAGMARELGRALDQHGLSALWARLTTGYLEQTPSGGLHLIYRVDGAPRRNLKLARRPATAAELAENPDDKVKVLIETRGQGGFTIVAPSGGRTHPDGTPWQLLAGGPASVPVLTVDERDALHAVAGLLDQMPDDPGPQPAVSSGAFAQPAATSSDGKRPGDDYNERASWDDILTPHGWTAVRRFGQAVGWRRPGKDDGVSATTGRNDADNLYVFSSSTEFETERPYSKFAAYALLEHGGDYRAAASALRAAGYGSQPAPSAPLRLVSDQPGPDSPPPASSGPDGAAAPEVDRTSWWPRDLTAVLAGTQEADEEPAHLARDDGHRLLYAGKVNGLIGESESGKTWVALLAVLQAITVAEHVLYLDFEDSAAGIVGRLRALGATDQHLQHLTYISPDEDLHLLAQRDLAETVLASSPALVVVDGVNAAMTLLGLDLEKNKDVTHFGQSVLKPLKKTGATVLTVDHVTKAKEGRGSYAIGAQAKRADVDGCSLMVEVQQPFGRGTTGKLRLTVAKDRPGRVRAVSAAAKHAGTAVLTSQADGGVQVRVHAPDTRPAEERPAFRPTALMERVSRFLESLPDGGASGNAIEGEVSGKREFVRQALDLLVTEGHVGRSAGARGAVLHGLLKPYREADDEAATGTDLDLAPTSPHLAPGEVENTSRRPRPEPPLPSGGRGRGPSFSRDSGEPESAHLAPGEDDSDRWYR